MLDNSAGSVNQGWQKSVSSEVPNSKKKTYIKLIYLPLIIIILILVGEFVLYQRYQRRAMKLPSVSQKEDIISITPNPKQNTPLIRIEGTINWIENETLNISLENKEQEMLLKLLPRTFIFLESPEPTKIPMLRVERDSLKPGQKVNISALRGANGLLEVVDIRISSQ